MMGLLEAEKKIILDNIKKIKEDIEHYSPYPEQVKILAATKSVDIAKINYALSCGCDLMGENRVNELMDKYQYLDVMSDRIHFIGRLQRNKVKYLVGKVSLIHSVDSVSLAKEINRISLRDGVVSDILIQINIGLEESKGGINPEQVDEFIDQILPFTGVRIRGLMAIPPYFDEKKKINAYFEEMCKIFVDIQHKNVDNNSIDFLSLGMSSDYREALAHGANIIRPGSAIFGERL